MIQKRKKYSHSWWIKIMVLIGVIHTVSFLIINELPRHARSHYLELMDYIPYVIGYAFALWGGHLVIYRIARDLWDVMIKVEKVKAEIGDSGRNEPLTWGLGGPVGIIERAVYITAFLSSQFNFVAVWLALKVAVSWKFWTESSMGRTALNAYLLNSLLSLVYAFVGWLMIKWYYEVSYRFAVMCLPVLLVIASYGLWIWLRKEIRMWESTAFREWEKQMRERKDDRIG